MSHVREDRRDLSGTPFPLLARSMQSEYFPRPPVGEIKTISAPFVTILCFEGYSPLGRPPLRECRAWLLRNRPMLIFFPIPACGGINAISVGLMPHVRRAQRNLSRIHVPHWARSIHPRRPSFPQMFAFAILVPVSIDAISSPITTPCRSGAQVFVDVCPL